MTAGPVLFHLNGLPAAGKLTVARAMARLGGARGHRVVVVDNHLTGNPVLSVLDLATGPPSPEAWDLVYEIREIVVRAIEAHSPPDWSFVFTNVLTEEGNADTAAVSRLRRLADSRGARYVPVVLTCDVDELLRRAASGDRAEQHKLTDPDVVRRYAETRRLHHPDGCAVLDVTRADADTTATALLDLAGLT